MEGNSNTASTGRQLQTVWRRLQKEQVARLQAEAKLKKVEEEHRLEHKNQSQFGQAQQLLDKTTKQLEVERKAKLSVQAEMEQLHKQIELQSKELENTKFALNRLQGTGEAETEAALLQRCEELEAQLNAATDGSEYKEMAQMYEAELKRANRLEEELMAARRAAKTPVKTSKASSQSHRQLAVDLQQVTQERDHLKKRLDTEVSEMYQQMQLMYGNMEPQLNAAEEELAQERQLREQLQARRLDLEVEIEELKMAYTHQHEEYQRRSAEELEKRVALEAKLDEAGLLTLNAKEPLPPGRPFSREVSKAMAPVIAWTQESPSPVEEEEAQMEARIAVLEARAKAKMAEIQALQQGLGA